MEEEYDYSIYTTVCTINICSVSNVFEIHRVNNRIFEASARYVPKKYLQIPLEFYYSKENGNIIYNSRMIYHYKQYPPNEKYFHVSSFVEDLYKLYQRSCKGEPATQDDKKLCSAITSFLTKVYPSSQLSVDGQASTTQYAFVLPSQKHVKKDFIDTTLRPLLQTTPWLTLKNSASKTVFYSRIDTYAYKLNDIKHHEFCLEREKKYLFCTLQKTSDHRRLMLTVNFIRAVYDPDLIAASGKSMTALGENIMLSSKLVSPPLSLEVPIDPTLAKMDRLAIFLYNKVFDGEEDSNPTLLEEYNTDSSHYSLIHRLISSISTSNSRDIWSNKINTNYFIDSSWSNMLSENMKSRLSCITHGDIMQFFDDVDVSSIESKIGHYLQKYGDGEIFQSIAFSEQDDDHELAYMEIKPYKTHNLLFAEKICQRFYMLRLKKTIVCLLEQLKKSKRTKVVPIQPWTAAECCAFKILKIVQLSNRLGRPIVMKSVGENKQESSKAPAIQKEKLALINKIQPYGYYVEANITCSNEIKLSLNQVIEAMAEDGKLQKSTLSILDSSWQTSDMYDFIFDTLWSNIDGHYADPQCKLLQEDETMGFDNYKIIRVELINAIKNSMENTSNAIHDLDEVIYHIHAESDCTCDILITHRLVINTGLLSYLKCIAGEIVASLKTNAIFGNYKISCLIVTGKFLYKWLEQGNSTYGELIWNQLQKEISSALIDKQLCIHLMMMKSIILEDNNLNFKLFTLEKYRQIFSKQYYLKILPNMKNFQVYQDRGDYCVKVPITKQDDDLIWEIPLLAIESKRDLKCSLSEKIYIVFGSEDADKLYCKIRLLLLSPTDLDNVDTALSSQMSIALMSDILPIDSSKKVLKARSTFPLEVKIAPCSYSAAINLQMRMGIDATADDPIEYEHVAYSERLTLKNI